MDVYVFLYYGVLFYYTSMEYIWIGWHSNPNRRIFLLKCFVFLFGDPLQSLHFSQHHILHRLPCSSNGKESACHAGDQGSIPGLGSSSGEGNGNPLQYSCLENSMDREAWWATVRGVAKSRTRLSDSHTHTHTHKAYILILHMYKYIYTTQMLNVSVKG